MNREISLIIDELVVAAKAQGISPDLLAETVRDTAWEYSYGVGEDV